jgi:hypothetical protein
MCRPGVEVADAVWAIAVLPHVTGVDECDILVECVFILVRMLA